MWEQIRSNKRKSVILIFLMAFLLVILGYVIGYVAAGPEAAPIGVAVAVILWIILTLTALGGGDSIMLATAGARKIEKQDLPVVYNCVEEMTIAAGLPKPPEVYLIDSNVPNAFAVGSPKRSAVAVTTGLVSRLNRDELQNVIAHEIGHIHNYDTRFIVLAGVLVGAIVLISDIFLRGLFHSSIHGRSRRHGNGQGGNQAQAIMMIVAIALAILAPIFAHLMYFACSRRREYLADASAARFTRYPEGLASALEKIAGGITKDGEKVNRVVAPMYIVNPLAAHGVAGLWSTHPPTEQRVNILRGMGGGASYANYEKAYSQLSGTGASVIGASALTADQAEIPVREASAESESTPIAARRREAIDVLRRQGGFRFAQCACGTRMKIPPVLKAKEIACPSCGRTVSIPQAAGS